MLAPYTLSVATIEASYDRTPLFRPYLDVGSTPTISTTRTAGALYRNTQKFFTFMNNYLKIYYEENKYIYCYNNNPKYNYFISNK